jgi:hypothetical protein
MTTQAGFESGFFHFSPGAPEKNSIWTVQAASFPAL